MLIVCNKKLIVCNKKLIVCNKKLIVCNKKQSPDNAYQLTGSYSLFRMIVCCNAFRLVRAKLLPIEIAIRWRPPGTHAHRVSRYPSRIPPGYAYYQIEIDNCQRLPGSRARRSKSLHKPEPTG